MATKKKPEPKRKTLTRWPDKPSYDEDEFARLVGLSTKTLRRLRKAGKLSFSRVGEKKVVYTRQDWQDYVENSRRQAFAYSVPSALPAQS